MQDEEILRIILLVTNSFSLLGSTFVMIAYSVFKSIRSFSFRLVFFMSIADFVHSICLMLPSFGIYCKIQGFLLQFTAVSSIIWSVNIALCLYLSVVLINTSVPSYEPRFLIAGYIFPFILAFVPVILDNYKDSGGWCWISGTFFENLTERILLFYIFIWAAMIFNISVYFKVILKLKEDYGNIVEYKSQNNLLIRRLSMYPIILVITYTPISFKRTYEIWGDTLPFWFTCVAAFGISITGFTNALVYGLTGPVKNAIKAMITKDDRPLSAFSLYSERFAESFSTNNL